MFGMKGLNLIMASVMAKSNGLFGFLATSYLKAQMTSNLVTTLDLYTFFILKGLYYANVYYRCQQ